MTSENNEKNTNRQKTVLLIVFLIAAVSAAVVFAAKAAENTGMYWIGFDSEFTAEQPEDNQGFFTVDVSDFLNNTAAFASETSEDAEEKELVPLAIGPLPSIPTLTEEELKLYEVLSRGDGVISSSDKDALDEDIHWTEVVLEPGDTLKSIAEEFGITEEDLRTANGMKKGENPSLSEVLYVPDSHDDVTATLLFVRKLQKEEILLAKKGKQIVTSPYTVREGDTLWALADRFNLDVDTIVDANKKILKGNINHLRLGTDLRIPNQDGIFVKVSANDTISKLADKYGSTTESVMVANSLDSEKLKPGSEIFLPGGKSIADTTVKITTTKKDGQVRSATVNISKKISGKISGKLSGKVSGGSTTVGAVRGLRWPVLGQISSPFGWRRSPFGRRRVFHAGLDIRAPRGTIIRAAASGVVVHSGWMGGYGKAVVISHPNGLTTLYGHCSKLAARSGAKVSQGQTIAYVGSTGRSTGNHVHFEVRVGGSPRNPLKYLR